MHHHKKESGMVTKADISKTMSILKMMIKVHKEQKKKEPKLRKIRKLKSKIKKVAKKNLANCK